MATINLEVIAPLISGVKHCQHCQVFMDDAGIDHQVQREELNSYPEEMWRDYTRLSQMVRDLAARYGAGLRIVLIDPHTPVGLWKSLRHWVRSYPAFIVNGQEKYVGWDLEAVDTLLRARGAIVSAVS
ncbi:MAG TPA: hypothetical protein VLH58_04885 [Candidatus Methylomirabilis sp.]|nr:hypothetical protein [Candidatus Methylomirabilis sp.]HSC70664.1 hypothetical protein [Candidatus Methylomirabilis sp.]